MKVLLETEHGGGSHPYPKQSVIEALPTEIILLIFQDLRGCHGLCLALTSTKLWSLYKSTTSHIPSLWTHTTQIVRDSKDMYTAPENYPSQSGDFVLLGSLLQDWMGPKYRMIRLSPDLSQQRQFHTLPVPKRPSFFIKSNWRDKKWWFKQHEGKLVDRYSIYWECCRSGKYLLPHPRNKKRGWWSEAEKAIQSDYVNFETTKEWEDWWQDDYRWYFLEANAKSAAERLVRDALGIRDEEWIGG